MSIPTSSIVAAVLSIDPKTRKVPDKRLCSKCNKQKGPTAFVSTFPEVCTQCRNSSEDLKELTPLTLGTVITTFKQENAALKQTLRLGSTTSSSTTPPPAPPTTPDPEYPDSIRP